MVATGLDILYEVRRFSSFGPVCIDGWIFRLHYCFTSTALLAASAVAFAKQYFGDPIECIFDTKHGAEIKAVDAYCWLHSTVNLDMSLMRKLNTLPKVRSPCQGYASVADHDIDTLYYQWVPFFLLFQALLFRLPWTLWQHLEGGKMAEFGLEAKRHLMPDESAEMLARQYADFFRGLLHHNNVYFWQYFFCETLSSVTAVVMIFVTDSFLNGRFFDYGAKVWDFYRTDVGHRMERANPMCSLFPTVTSCQFPSGAVTGNLNVDHAMCVLSLNIINDKIFLLEWAWFFSLAAVSLFASCLTCLAIVCPKFRSLSIRTRVRTWGSRDANLISELLDHCYVGDYFVLNLMAKNTNTYLFRRVIKVLAETVRDQRISKTVTISIDNIESRNGV